jgi:phosphatidylinositol kinase/protein kinase (PI-3  family)
MIRGDIDRTDSNLPCFALGEQTAQQLRERFQLSSTRAQCDEFVDRLIDSSALSVFTRLYDAFQVRVGALILPDVSQGPSQAYSQGIL